VAHIDSLVSLQPSKWVFYNCL